MANIWQSRPSLTSLFGPGVAALAGGIFGARTQPVFGSSETLQAPVRSTPTGVRIGPVTEAERRGFAEATRPVVRDTGGGGRTTTTQPTQQPTDQGLPLENVPLFNEPQYDIGPALQALTQAEQASEAERSAGFADIEAGRTGALGRIQTAEEEQVGGLGQQAQRETSRIEQNIAEQRLGQAELARGIRARFGKAVSTGLGAEAILGQQTLKTIGQARTALTQTLSDIDAERNRVLREDERLREQVEAGVEAAKEGLRATFMRNLAEIGTKRGQLMADRASTIAAAMSDYQDAVRDINARNNAFKQELFLRKQELQQSASTAEQRNIKQFLTNLGDYVSSGIISSKEARGVLDQEFGTSLAGTQVLPGTAGGPEKEKEETQSLLNRAGFSF